MMQARPWFIWSVIALALAAVCGCGGGAQKVLYALAPGSDNVSIFMVSSAGALSASDSVSTGTGPVAMAIDPLLRFAYVVDSAGGIGPGGDSQYTLNAGSGALAVATLPASNGTTPPSIPAPTGVNPTAIAIDSTGSFVFVANQGSNSAVPATCATIPSGACPSISVYSIDQTGGALTEVKQPPPSPTPIPSNCVTTPPSPVTCPLSTAAGPTALAITGTTLLVINSGAGLVSAYPFNSSGLLDGTKVVTTTVAGSALAMDSKGTFLFVTDPVANTVAAFSIASSGQLTAVGSPVPTGTTPVSVHVHPGGKFLFTANQGSNNVSAFSISSSGALTPLSGSPVAAGTGPSSVTTDTGGSFLFVANRDSNTISVFSIDSSGALKGVNGSPFPSVVTKPVALASIN
jgi:6-phosphogluconolactonase